MKDVKKSFKNRKFKMGGYQTLILVIVLVLVVVLNLMVNKLNITVDLSSDQKFTLTESSKKLADATKDNIKMYYMCQDGSQTIQIEKVLEQYDGRGNIEVVDKDPVIYPNFSKEYTDDEIQSNDVIVVNETNGKSKLVAATDMLVQDMDYSTYQQTYTLDAEGQLTAAIQSVTSTSTQKLYYTSGHGEGELNASFLDVLKKSNMEYEALATQSAEGVPEDCSILLVNGMQYDFKENEYTMISEYLKGGGKAMFFLDPTVDGALKNYNKVLSDYGVNVVEGYVIDSQGAMNEQYPTMLAPTVEEHDITSEVGNTAAIVAVGKGMTSQSDVRSTLQVESLLTTTEGAFSKVDYQSSEVKKEDDDIAGPFSLALAVKDQYSENTQGEGKATKLVVFGSSNFAAADFIANNQYGNRSMVLKSLTYLLGEETQTLAIPTRSLDQESVIINEGDRVFYTALLVVVVPLMLLAIGFVIWYRRRKN